MKNEKLQILRKKKQGNCLTWLSFLDDFDAALDLQILSGLKVRTLRVPRGNGGRMSHLHSSRSKDCWWTMLPMQSRTGLGKSMWGRKRRSQRHNSIMKSFVQQQWGANVAASFQQERRTYDIPRDTDHTVRELVHTIWIHMTIWIKIQSPWNSHSWVSFGFRSPSHPTLKCTQSCHCLYWSCLVWKPLVFRFPDI